MLIICCICFGLTVLTGVISNLPEVSADTRGTLALFNTLIITAWLWIITCQVFNI